MSKLTGKALQDRAKELGIQGRSKLSADELRDRIARIEQSAPDPDLNFAEEIAESNREAEERRSEVVARVIEGYRAMRDGDPTTVVPNRAEKRAFKRAQSLRNDGSPRGGKVATGPRKGAFEASVKAGQRGKDYGNRKRDVNLPGFDVVSDSESVRYTPRSVPVKVVHEGF